MAENKLRLYRALLRGVRNYPSMKRGQYEQEIKTAFRENKTLTDPEKIEKEMNEAVLALKEFQRFVGYDANSNWTWSPEWHKSV